MGIVKTSTIETIRSEESLKYLMKSVIGEPKMEHNKSFYINNVEVKKCLLYPNYAASKCGKIYRISSGKLMASAVNTVGSMTYVQIRICHNNKASTVKRCRMVASAWIPNTDPARTHVNHINSISTDDRADNLEWVTPAENMNHGVKLGGKGIGENLYNSKLTDAEVHDVCKLLRDGLVVKDIAKKFNVSKDIIRKIRAGDTYFHIRCLYDLDHKYLHEFSESTVRWVCDKVSKGWSDKKIADESSNKNLTIIDVKRIRYGIRYYDISKEYFKDLCPTTMPYGIGGKLMLTETGES